MKRLLLLAIIYSSFSANAQNIEWVKKSTTPITPRFYQDSSQLYIAAYSNYYNFIFDNAYNGYASGPITGKLNKAGAILNMRHYSELNIVPVDFARTQDDKIMIAGTAVGGNDIQISKLSNSSSADWKRFFTSNPPPNQQSPYYPDDYATSNCIVDNSEYITAVYEGTLAIDNGIFTGSNAMVAKFDIQTGNTIWKKNIPGYGAARIRQLNANSLIIASQVMNSETFDNIPINPSMRSTVIARIDTNANFTFAKIVSEGTTVSDMVTDASGNIFITGDFHDSCRINNSWIGTNGGFFLIKTDPNGNVLWYRTADGSPFTGTSTRALAVDNNGNVFLCGNFSTNTLNLQDTVLTRNAPGVSAFIVKYSPNGTVLHAYNLSGDSYGFYITTDDDGSVYWSGRFYNTLTVGNKTLTSNTTNNEAAFLIKINYSTVTSEKHNSFSGHELYIYPNPAANQIAVLSEEKILHVKLINSLGETLLVQEGMPENTLQIAGFSKGIYFIEVSTAESKKLKKIIIE